MGEDVRGRGCRGVDGGSGGVVVVIKAWAVGDKDVRGPERVESWC